MQKLTKGEAITTIATAITIITTSGRSSGLGRSKSASRTRRSCFENRLTVGPRRMSIIVIHKDRIPFSQISGLQAGDKEVIVTILNHHIHRYSMNQSRSPSTLSFSSEKSIVYMRTKVKARFARMLFRD